jgi:hypothetical protein
MSLNRETVKAGEVTILKMKYAEEVRLSLGVAQVKYANDAIEGAQRKPFFL